MNRPPNDEGPALPSSRNGDAGPSEINLTLGNLAEQDSLGNQKVARGDLRLDCGHASPEECAAADIAALFPKNAPSEPAGLAHEPLLTRTDCAEGSSVVRLPTHWSGSDAFHELVIFWNGAPDERVLATLKRLWIRRLLPGSVLSVYVCPDKLVLVIDAPDLGVAATYQTALNAIAWGFPWRLVVSPISADALNLAHEAGLGLRYLDDALTGSAP
jgi:hypothetical protein